MRTLGCDTVCDYSIHCTCARKNSEEDKMKQALEKVVQRTSTKVIRTSTFVYVDGNTYK